jgi:hypothetical protein
MRIIKAGLWKVFLDEKFKIISDSSKAFYYGYETYDNGNSLYPLVQFKKGIITSLKSEVGKPIPLNGALIIQYKNGKVSTEANYSNGFPTIWYGYRWDKTGRCTMKESLDYSKQYKNQPGSFYYEKYNQDNILVETFYFGKKENGKWDYIK